MAPILGLYEPLKGLMVHMGGCQNYVPFLGP